MDSFLKEQNDSFKKQCVSLAMYIVAKCRQAKSLLGKWSLSIYLSSETFEEIILN